jgi:ankyrin repeat protein
MKKFKLLSCLSFFSIINACNYQNQEIIWATYCDDVDEVKNICTPTNINTQNNEGQTALMHSCIYGSGDIFTFLMENNADIKVKDKSGKTALDYAIEHNRPKMIKFLLLSDTSANLSLDEALKKAAEIEKIKIQTRNLFKELCSDDPNINIIKSCISAGADLNDKHNYSASGRSALIIAAMYGHTGIVRLLIDSGADVNATKIDGYTALMAASSHGYTEIVQLLIAAGANVNASENITGRELRINNECIKIDGYTALMIATSHGYTEIVKLLIDAGANVNARGDIEGNTALIIAAKLQNLEIIKLLVNNRADINFKVQDYVGKTIFDHALDIGNSEIIEFLLLSGADDNLSLDKALKKSAEIKNIKNQTQNLFKEIYSNDPNINIIKSCISAGADVNAYDRSNTALIIAAKNANTEIARLLIAANADVNARDNNGRSALMIAAMYGHTGIVRLLINAGADVNAKEESGYTKGMTVLIHSFCSRNTEIVQLLIDYGADINSTDDYGTTTLMFACAFGDAEIVKLFIDAGHDVNARDINGRTALMYVWILERRQEDTSGIEIAKLLIDAGADVNATDNKGQTAITYADYAEDDEAIEKLLKSYINPFKRFKYKNANLIKALAIGTVVGVAYKLWQNLTK